MSDPVDGWTVAGWLWGVLVTILGFLGVRALSRVDKHEEEISKLRAVGATKEDLEVHKVQHREELRELRTSMADTLENAVNRMESSNSSVMQQFQSTQSIILQHLMGKIDGE